MKFATLSGRQLWLQSWRLGSNQVKNLRNLSKKVSEFMRKLSTLSVSFLSIDDANLLLSVTPQDISLPQLVGESSRGVV